MTVQEQIRQQLRQARERLIVAQAEMLVYTEYVRLRIKGRTP